MTYPTQTVTLGDVFTRYAYHKVGGSDYKDNKYKGRPLLELLRERKLSASGGQNITHPVNLGTSSNGRSLSRNETFEIRGDANETWARYTLKVVVETCFVSWWDIRETDGNQFKMRSILDTRIDETRENMNDQIATMLAATSTSGNDITSIMSMVTTTGAVGGLNPATAGQTTWASETEATINWSVEGVGRARQLHRKITDNKGKPDVILLPSTYWQETCEIADAAVVINQNGSTRGGTKYAALGTRVPFILDVPVIHDPAWDTAESTTGVMLDLDGIHLVVDPKWDMYMWPFKDMVHTGRLGQASVQLEVAELTMSSRRTQGSFTSLS